ncbi:MAG: GIY-YIG nuclease family protein [Candidatus Hydrogenedentes bacterium]|nr:GIY-YIG nuclease family protein [Candidatus Hydrogenedentota bacterium]
MVILYVLQGDNRKRYVGITNDLTRRLAEHRSGHSKAGQLLGNIQLLMTEEFDDYPTARKREMFLKSGQGRAWLDARFPRESEPA